jgi:hypothetical protein
MTKAFILTTEEREWLIWQVCVIQAGAYFDSPLRDLAELLRSGFEGYENATDKDLLADFAGEDENGKRRTLKQQVAYLRAAIKEVGTT